MSVQFKKRSKTTKQIRSKEDEEDIEDEQVTIVKSDVSGPMKGIVASSGTKRTAETLSQATVFESTREVVPQSYSGSATHVTEIDTAADRDSRAVLEKSILSNQEGVTAADLDSAVYKGQAAYKTFVKKDMSQVGANKFTGTQGPIRAPAFLRSSCRFDYQPDICKDYKETGFCGYGDQCKFLHDRGDYKSGWQLEKEWDAQQAKKKKALETAAARFDVDGNAIEVSGEEVEAEEENFEIPEEEALPFACHICREEFKDPVVTNCEHYFCRECALERGKKTGRCAVCDKQTSGVFNRAEKLIRKLVRLGKLQETGSSRVKIGSRSGGGFVEKSE